MFWCFFKSVVFLVDVPVANYGNSFRELCHNIDFKCGHPHCRVSFFKGILHWFFKSPACSLDVYVAHFFNLSACPFQQFKCACFPNGIILHVLWSLSRPAIVIQGALSLFALGL
jgi:hypothetical protein